MAPNGVMVPGYTFNTHWGCTKVSPACKSCYAERWAHRMGLKIWGQHTPRRFFGAKHWHAPVRWNAHAQKTGIRRKVFCSSMADVFELLPQDHPDLGKMDEARRQLWAVIAATPWLDWLLLTKRPENVLDMVPVEWLTAWPVNVWMGTTTENQEEYDKRAPVLAGIPAPVRFLSCEPLLGPVFLNPALPVDWVITGGESGPGCRDSAPNWFRMLRDHSVQHGVPFFFKQWGGHPDKRGGAAAVIDGARHIEMPISRAAVSQPTPQSALPLR